MDAQPLLADVIEELESRHDELLSRLEELDQRVAQVLNEWAGKHPSEPSVQAPKAA